MKSSTNAMLTTAIPTVSYFVSLGSANDSSLGEVRESESKLILASWELKSSSSSSEE